MQPTSKPSNPPAPTKPASAEAPGGATATPPPVKAAGKLAGATTGSTVGVPPTSNATGPGGPSSGPQGNACVTAPTDWADIGVGSLVLALDGVDAAGYFLARVLATKADDCFVLAWEDYEDYPEVSRPRRELALLHPDQLRGR